MQTLRHVLFLAHCPSQWKSNNGHIVLARLNRLLMVTVGGSDWTLCSAFVLPCRIIHTTLVYPLSLYPLFLGFYFFNGLMLVLQALHIFWAVLILRMAIKFLPGNVWTATGNFPSDMPHNTSPQSSTGAHLMFEWCLFPRQDIVEDERSDKEETESDEDANDEPRALKSTSKKSKNGHVRNGHTHLNNNHSKADWKDCKRWRWLWEEWRPAFTWKPKSELREVADRTHKNTHIFIHNLPLKCRQTCVDNFTRLWRRQRWRTTVSSSLPPQPVPPFFILLTKLPRVKSARFWLDV